MKLKVGDRKTVLIIASILLVVMAAAATYMIANRQGKDEDQQQSEDGYQPSELSVPTDFYAPEIDEVKKQYSEPADQYAQLINYAYLKETVKKYDESILLYEAAIEVAPDEELKKDAQYSLYWLAVNIDRKDLADQYAEILGEDFLKAKAEANIGRDE